MTGCEKTGLTCPAAVGGGVAIFTTFIEAEWISFNRATYLVRYFKQHNGQGAISYSLEVQLNPDDRVVIDGPSLERLRQKLHDILPAALYSRMVVAMKYHPHGASFKNSYRR